jgi:GTP-binding protein Era
MTSATEPFKSGFIGIIGAPNVGKSTLMNRLLGQKLSITSSKPQTTRNRILGVVHRPDGQMVFIDTPGIHNARSALNLRIVDAAYSVLADVDIILLMVDITKKQRAAEKLLINAVGKQKKPVLLALNKIDLVSKDTALTHIERWRHKHDFAALIPISARKGTQVGMLVQEMMALLPAGPPFFPEDSLTDLPEKFVAAEIVREKVFRLTGQEVPYAIAVTVDQFIEESAFVTIHATIHVERNSQKGILIGKGGSKLKQIGSEARLDLKRLLGANVLLKLFVRVQKNWSSDTRALRKFGY